MSVFKEFDVFSTMWLILFFLLWCFSQEPKKKKQKKLEEKKKWGTIIGLETVKKELNVYFDFIQHADKYQNVRLPRGILLSGPPGCGKTLLVKAMAQELDIPLHAASGSEFIEKYVGVGAARIRALFTKAKAPGLIFIDEIDAIASRRDVGEAREQARTLNQLLVEMDGFQSKPGVMVFAATNLMSVLDPALLRSGRFDTKIHFDLPNRHERLEMYRLYLKGETLPNGMSISLLAERSTGLSGADIEAICNQAKLNTIQRKGDALTTQDLHDALDEIMIGREKRERVLKPAERRRVAFHEAGHACMAFWLKHASSPIKVSVVPRGASALGFSQSKPSSRFIQSEMEVRASMAVLFGGRSAERLVFNSVSTGAADDLERIQVLVKRYFLSFGMGAKPFYDELPLHERDDLIDKIETFVGTTLQHRLDSLTAVAEQILTHDTILHTTLQTLLKDESSLLLPSI